MPKGLPVEWSESFAGDFGALRSNAVAEHVISLITNLSSFPHMGNPNPRESLRVRYGSKIRTYALEGYVLVYDTEGDVVHLHALFPARMVK